MNLDLGVYYPIRIGEKKEIRLTGDWFNVFNSRAVTLDQTYSINSGVTGVPATQSVLRIGVVVQLLRRSGLAPSSASNRNRPALRAISLTRIGEARNAERLSLCSQHQKAGPLSF